jgi:hypothetical protein
MGCAGQFWYARVPSPSNIADDPSRLETASFENDESFIQAHVRMPYSFWNATPYFY